MGSDVEAVRRASLFTYKIVFLGDQSVGKTSIVTRFMFGQTETKYQATVGIDFLSKTVNFDGLSLRLQLWDTGGQERFRSLIPSYIRDTSAAVVVYDITDANTFKQANRWVDDVRAERDNNVVIMLVGNKSDQPGKRQVSAESGEALAKEMNAMFIETSAKEGWNVEQLFRRLVGQLPWVEEATKRLSIEGSTIKLEPKKEHCSPCWC